MLPNGICSVEEEERLHLVSIYVVFSILGKDMQLLCFSFESTDQVFFAVMQSILES